MILSKPDIDERISEGIVSRPDGRSIVVDHASVGLHLGPTFIRYLPLHEPIVPPFHAPSETLTIGENETIDFPPGGRLLAATCERVSIPLDLIGFVQTKGSIARGFIMAHLCDGQIDPGFCGNITLELANLSNYNYRLYPGMAIAQLFLIKLSTKLQEGYEGRYQCSQGPTTMRR